MRAKEMRERLTKSERETQRKSERGATMIEYSLLVVLIAIIGIGGVRFFAIRSSALHYASACSIKNAHKNVPDLLTFCKAQGDACALDPSTCPL